MKGIITLCGSTKFPESFKDANSALTKSDWIVLSVGTVVRKEYHDPDNPEALKLKVQLDRLHKEKIAISQAVVILNPSNYIGDSTKSELAYARSLNKQVYWLFFDYEYNSLENFSSHFMNDNKDKDWKELLI